MKRGWPGAATAEQCGPVGVGVFQIVGDRPGVRTTVVFAVDQHRHLPWPEKAIAGLVE